MPRFRIKTLLIFVAIAALWFSTFGGYTGADDVRATLSMLLLVASAMMVYCCAGRQRAFWLAFTLALFIMASGTIVKTGYMPFFAWANNLASGHRPGGEELFGPPRLDPAMEDTIRVLGTIAVSFVAGVMGRHIYDSHRPQD